MSGYTVLKHSQHEGYYSPNNTANKATPYIFDTVVKSSDGRQIGMRFKGTGDREWVIIYVPSTDFTPTYNNIIKLINDNKDVSNRKVVIRENEKAKAARIVTNFFNSPSIAGNEKMTSYVKKPQYLKHSDDLDIIDVSNEVLEHANKIDGNKQYYYTGKCRAYTTQQGFNRVSMSFMSKQGKGFELIIDVKPNDPNETINSIRLKAEQFLRLYHKDEYFDNQIPNNQIWKACEDALKQLKRDQQHTGYYSPNLLGHSLFTEVYDMDDYLEHHGVLGMKWGVRRYQNKDGSLTAEGRKHYNVKTLNSTRAELENAKDDRERRLILTKAENKAGGDYVKGVALGTGAAVASTMAKQAVAKAAAGTVVKDLVYNSLTGSSQLITSVLPAAVPGWAAALTNPVGQIALAAVGTVAAGKAVYGLYKAVKLSELAAEFDVSDVKTRSIDQAIKNGMEERERRQQTSTHASGFGNDTSDIAAHREAAKYGLDKGDNYKVFRDALAGDTRAQKVVEDWKKSSYTYTPEQQREKLSAAKNNDRYDLDFLEFMQNTKISYDNNKTALNNAYKEYLKDPEAFATDPDFYKKYPYA